MISSEQIIDIENRLKDLFKFLSIEDKQNEIADLEKTTLKDDFWNNADAAQKILKQISKIKVWVKTYSQIKTE